MLTAQLLIVNVHLYLEEARLLVRQEALNNCDGITLDTSREYTIAAELAELEFKEWKEAKKKKKKELKSEKVYIGIHVCSAGKCVRIDIIPKSRSGSIHILVSAK